MPISTDNYSKEMLKLLDIYYQSGIWKKYNWYDFLDELLKILRTGNSKTYDVF